MTNKTLFKLTGLLLTIVSALGLIPDLFANSDPETIQRSGFSSSVSVPDRSARELIRYDSVARDFTYRVQIVSHLSVIQDCDALWARTPAREFVQHLEKATASSMKVWGNYTLRDGTFVLYAGDLANGNSCFGIWRRGQAVGFKELPDQPRLSTPLYGFFRTLDDKKEDADPALVKQVSSQPSSISDWLRASNIKSAVIMPVEFPKFPFKIPSIVKVQLAIHEAFHMEVQFRFWLTGKGDWPAWDRQPDRKGVRACYSKSESVKIAFDDERETLALFIEALLDKNSCDACRLGKEFLEKRSARYRKLKDVSVSLHDKSAGTCAQAETIMELEEGIADYASWTMLYNLKLVDRDRLMIRYRANQKDAFYLTGAMQMHAISLLNTPNANTAINKISKSKNMKEGGLTSILKQELRSYCIMQK